MAAQINSDIALTLLRCLFAIVFATIMVALLRSANILPTPSEPHPDTGCYTTRAAVQDVKSIITFMLGVACCLTFARNEHDDEEAEDEDRCSNSLRNLFLMFL